jgi:hypothetical protein
MTARMRRRMAAATALALLCSTTSNAQGLSFFWCVLAGCQMGLLHGARAQDPGLY